MSLSENIRNRRIKKSYTQQQFAEKVGVGRSMIAQIERGTKIPNMMLGKEIARVLECSMDELVKETQEV